MPNGETNQSEYSDVHLADYLKVLIKRKWLIILLFSVSVIAAAVYSFMMPKVYSIDTALEIGSLGIIQKDNGDRSNLVIEDPTQVVEKLKGDAYGILVRRNLNIPEDKYPRKIVDNPKDTMLVKILIKSSDAQLAKRILEEINRLIITEHSQKVKVQTSLINENIKTIEEKIKLTQSNSEKTNTKISNINYDITRIENKITFAGEEKQNLEAKVEALQKVLVYQQDPGTQFALFDAKERLASKNQEIESLFMGINNLKKDEEDLRITMNSLEASIDDYRLNIDSLEASLSNVRDTDIVKEPTISEEPIGPDIIANTLIAGIIGLFFAIFLAFLLDWLAKNRQRLQ